jgi:hypothetical protein
LLDAFDRGGQSALEFSRSHGFSHQTFIAWLRKRREGGASLPPGISSFAEVILEQAPPSSSAALRILLPCGTVIEVASRAALPLAAELLSTLRRPCCGAWSFLLHPGRGVASAEHFRQQRDVVGGDFLFRCRHAACEVSVLIRI